MSDVVESVVRVLGGAAKGKHLDFEGYESAFDTETDPAVRFPVVHIEELVGLMAFVCRERRYACAFEQGNVFFKLLVFGAQVEPVLGVGQFVNGLGQSKRQACVQEGGRSLDVVTEFAGQRHVCREVVVLAVQFVGEGVLFASRKLAILFVYVKGPAGITVKGSDSTLDTQVVAKVVSVEVVHAHAHTPYGVLLKPWCMVLGRFLAERWTLSW